MIINLTRRRATSEQIIDGVIDLSEFNFKLISELLTFTEIPDVREIITRARKIASFAAYTGHPEAMIDGAPWLMIPLQIELWNRGITALYSFSARVVEEEVMYGNKVRKTVRFKHIGFLPA